MDTIMNTTEIKKMNYKLYIHLQYTKIIKAT